MNMLSNKMTNVDLLALRIQKLQSVEFDQYNTLKGTITTIATSADPINIGKKIFTDFIDINVNSTDLNKSGLLAVTDFFIGKILGKYRSASKYMLSILVQKITSFLILKSNK